jgi:TonB family protein
VFAASSRTSHVSIVSLVVAAAAFEAAWAVAGSERLAEAREQLARCAAATLKTEPAAPMQLEYRVEVVGGRAGTFRRSAAAAGAWVDELSFDGASAARGVAAGGPWQTPAESLAVEWWAITTLLDLDAQLRLAGDERVTAVKDRRVKGVALREVSIERDDPRAIRTLFLDADAVLLLGSVNPVERREYTGWTRVEGVGWVPRGGRMLLGKRLVAQIDLVGAVATAPPPAWMEPPAGAAEWAYCPGSRPARVRERAHPEYPEAVRQNRGEGTVVLLARVGVDGAVRRVNVVLTPEISRRDAAALGAAAAEALRRTRYEPPTCDGVPQEVDVVTAVSFALH